MKKTLMLDLDNVITDGTWKEQIEEFIGEKIDLKKTGYYLESVLGDKKQEFYDSLDEINMYKNAEFMTGARDVIEQLNEKYDLYIVSSFGLNDIPNRVGEHLKNKYEFIYKSLPFISQYKLMFINDKSKVKFDIGIDDKLNNLAGCNTKILYRAWHNENISEHDLEQQKVFIANNWQDIAKILL